MNVERIQFCLLAAVVFVFSIDSHGLVGHDNDEIWVGVAKVDVTPKVPVVLAGYGGRTKPFEAVETKLWARAMVIGKKNPVAIVVLDNCGVTREISDKVKTILADKGFAKERINVATTHTHNAPNLNGYAPILWQGRMTADQTIASTAYTKRVVDLMVAAIVKARKTAFPASLAWGQGRVTFGGNRRVIRDGNWAGFGFQMNAPVDHSLPILIARDKEKRVRAVWANYACHCTTIGSKNVISGDWAGYSNQFIEESFSDAVSLVSIGCGADVGPQPGGNADIAKRHGKSLANEVERMVAENRLEELTKMPSVKSTTIKLPLEKPKSKEHWEKLAQTRGFDQQLAIKMLGEIKKSGRISEVVEYPVSCWSFGDQLFIVFLPGEVVVDYAVRLKSELDWKKVWITAWANRMPGYIPSKKVLMQGGYEADFSQVYYGLPGRYQPAIEDLIVEQIRRLAGKSFENPKGQDPSPFHKPPSRRKTTLKLFRESLKSFSSDKQRILQHMRDLAPKAKRGLTKIAKGEWRRSHWFNLYGDTVDRAFIRQAKAGESISWEAAKLSPMSDGVYSFTGGLGWISQPKSKGFELAINGDSVQLDVAREPMKWTSKSKSFQLYYLPTWVSNEDSAGFFIVALRDVPLNTKSVTLTVRSLSSGSQRWIGFDTKQNFDRDLEQLRALLNSSPK